MNRRALLNSVGFLGMSSLTGCLDRFPLPRSTTLGRLTVSNHDGDASHVFDLRVERDDKVVHESSHTVDRIQDSQIPGVAADCTWNPVAGRYVVSARVDEGDWNEFDLLDQIEGSPDCVVTSVHYEPGPNTDRPMYVPVRADCDRYAGAVGHCPGNEANKRTRVSEQSK